MATIKIGRPYIEKCLNKKTRLCSNIEYQDGKNKVLYYEVEDEYAKYLSYEKSDCFVLGLLHNCMNQKCDISCEAPVSEQLLFTIKTTIFRFFLKICRIYFL